MGAAGLACAVALGAWLGRSLTVTLALAAIAAVCFVVLAFVTKMLRGTESLTYYHHEIAILSCCAVALTLWRQPVLPYLDIAVLSLGVFLAFGRGGCFLVGCCHGGPSAWGVRYGADAVAAGFPRHLEGVRVLPLQLIEAAWVLATVAAGVWIARHEAPGNAFAWYSIVYGWGRFGLEFLRGDSGRAYWLGFSEAQWTSLALMSVVAGLEIAGFVPYHGWHIAAVAGLAAATACLRAVTDPSRWITHPRHVAQLALLLDPCHSSPEPGSTSLGIRVSASRVLDAGGRTELFAFSGVPEAAIPRLAKLAARLRRSAEAPAMLPGKNGIYHLIFGAQGRQHAV